MSRRGSLRRGDMVFVELDPAVGAEQNKIRPCVVVSNRDANEAAHRLGHGVITVVPVTSNVRRVWPFEALIEDGAGLDRPGKAQAQQVRSVSVGRIVRVVGELDAEQLAALDEALRVHLDL